MSTTTSTDQDALRVANRYAGMVEKAVTLQARAQACLDAAAQYRADARANQESASNHQAAARTVRDSTVAHQHALAARDAEAEAAREILAARYYEAQAEQYGGAHQGLPTGPGPASLAAPATPERLTTVPQQHDHPAHTADASSADAGRTAADPAEAVPAGPAGTDRDHLARGIYVHESADAPDGWRAAGAVEWDTGQVTPEARAAAYARADEILAVRPAGDAPGASRWQTMQHHGIYACPDWCTQAHDEEQYEQHIGAGQVFTPADSDPVTVRPRVGWWDNTDEPAVELILPPSAGGGLLLTAAELSTLQQLTDDVLEQARDHHSGFGETKPAYPGADADDAAANFPPGTPDTPPVEPAADDGPGGYSTGDCYLDWSVRADDGTRELEIGDGTDAVMVDLSPPAMRQLRDELAYTLGMPDAADRDPANYMDLPGGGYLDWSMVHGGVRNIEACTADGATVQIHLDEPHLVELYERLSEQIHLEDARLQP